MKHGTSAAVLGRAEGFNPRPPDAAATLGTTIINKACFKLSRLNLSPKQLHVSCGERENSARFLST